MSIHLTLGSGVGQSGSLALHGSIGQAVAGEVAQGAFSAHSGFWQEAQQRIFLPLIVRSTS
ncbi:MAG: hypothetical protein JXM73_09310 [Anaerolineae bacterium]|nr:hypothetical protein [Anaerolineae bacterium]